MKEKATIKRRADAFLLILDDSEQAVVLASVALIGMLWILDGVVGVPAASTVGFWATLGAWTAIYLGLANSNKQLRNRLLEGWSVDAVLEERADKSSFFALTYGALANNAGPRLAMVAGGFFFAGVLMFCVAMVLRFAPTLGG